MSFLIAPLEALTDERLTDPEMRVLLALYSFRGKNTNTVWPQRDKLAKRAKIKDETRVSKITTSLSKKGWIKKKKRSFSSGNEYEMTMPECFAIMDSDAIVDSDATMDADATSNVASETTSNVASETTPIEEDHRTKPTEQKKNTRARTPKLDFESWPEQPSPQILADWQAMRKRKKADVSQTVINRFAVELRRAVNAGFTVDDCLGECVERNWHGFKFEWLQNSRQPKTQGFRQPVNPKSVEATGDYMKDNPFVVLNR